MSKSYSRPNISGYLHSKAKLSWLPTVCKEFYPEGLIGEIVDWTKELESTGVAERNQAFIRNVSKSFGFASNSKWSKSDLSGETAILNDFMQQVRYINLFNCSCSSIVFVLTKLKLTTFVGILYKYKT